MKIIGEPINEASFEELFKRYYRFLRRFLGSIIKDDEEAEDIAQDCFVKLWNRRNKSTVEEAKAFLFITGKNAILNKLRSTKIHKRHHSVIRAALQEVDDVRDVENQLIKTEVISLLYDAIERLSHSQRKVILASLNTTNKEGKEIASILGIPYNTYRIHRAEAFLSLRKVMGDISDENQVYRTRESLKDYFKKMRKIKAAMMQREDFDIKDLRRISQEMGITYFEMYNFLMHYDR